MSMSSNSQNSDDEPPYDLAFIPKALKEFKALDQTAKIRFQDLMIERRKNPKAPPKAALSSPLEGYWKVAIYKPAYRLVYRVDDLTRTIVVAGVGKREDAKVYERVLSRLADTTEFIKGLKPYSAKKPS